MIGRRTRGQTPAKRNTYAVGAVVYHNSLGAGVVTGTDGPWLLVRYLGRSDGQATDPAALVAVEIAA